MPNRPIATTTNPIPSPSTGRSKVKRSRPELTSVPTRPSSRPSSTIATALSSEPCASTMEPTRPSTISEKYSAARNWSASRDNGGLAIAISPVAMVPANSEPSAAMASAAPALPLRAIWYPSRHVTTDDDSPGMFTRIAVVEPPYCAP